MVKRFSYIRNTLTWDVNGKLQGNGMIVVPKTGHGERGLYQCKDGYVLKVNHKHYQSKFRFKMFLKGSNTTTCLYGVWEGVTPTCAEVRKMNILYMISLGLTAIVTIFSIIMTTVNMSILTIDDNRICQYLIWAL